MGLPQPREGVGDRRGMVSEVVDEEHIVNEAQRLLPTLDAGKAGQGRPQRARRQARVETSGQAGERVADVVLAAQGQVENPHLAARPAQGEARALGPRLEVGGAPKSTFFEAKGLHRRRRVREEFGDIGVGVMGQNQTVLRHHVDELAEGGGDFGEVLVDVGVVEFNVVDDEHLG